jgi:hypothetical protein
VPIRELISRRKPLECVEGAEDSFDAGADLGRTWRFCRAALIQFHNPMPKQIAAPKLPAWMANIAASGQIKLAAASAIATTRPISGLRKTLK